MCRNKHCAAASEFLFLQLLKDFLQVFFSAHYLKVSWLTVTRFSWYVTLPEDMSFSELPLQKEAPQSPGMPINSLHVLLLSFCRASTFWGGCPFWLPIYLACGSSPPADSGPFPSFWLADTAGSLILLSPLFPVPWPVLYPRCLPLLLLHRTVSQGNCHILMDLQTPFLVFFAPIHPFASWPRTDRNPLASVFHGVSFP